MAIYSESVINGINVALNEATLLGVEFDKEDEVIAATFSPIALDEKGQIPDDNRVQFIFKHIGKFIASYRLGNWNDEDAPIIKFEPEQILQKIQEFGGCPIYGWEFIDCKIKTDSMWLNKLSCEFISEHTHGMQHTIELFQDGHNKHINIKIWFDEFEIFTPTGEKIELQTFIDNGKRGWDGVYNGTASDTFAIYPMKGDDKINNTLTTTNKSESITEGNKKKSFPNFFKKMWKRLMSYKKEANQK